MKQLKKYISYILLTLCGLAGMTYSASTTEAGLYWGSGLPDLKDGVLSLDPYISVCFVGDAVTVREARVRQIIDYIKEFEHAANIRFVTLDGVRLQTAADTDKSQLTCPPPTQIDDNTDYFEGDIRVAIQNTELIPGTGLDWRSPIPGTGCEFRGSNLNSDPEAVVLDNGRIDLIWRGGWDNTLRHKNITLTKDGRWYNHQSVRINGLVTSGAALASLAPNNLHLFVRNNDGALLYRVGNRTDHGITWGSWRSLGGNLANDESSNPDAISISPNRLDVFVRWQDDTVRTITSLDGGVNWGDWENLGGSVTSSPSVTSWGDNRMDLFVRSSTSSLHQLTWAENSWETSWVDRGGLLSSAPDATSWGPGRIDVFVKGGNNVLYTNTFANAKWNGWVSLGRIITSGPTAISRGLESLNVFAKAANGDIAHWEYKRDEDNNLRYVFGYTGDNTGGSWGNEPWILEDNRSCMFNLKLGDANDADGIPARNHTLHEFGHSLGLQHEFDRNDGPTACPQGKKTHGFLTPYDINSVMEYTYKPTTEYPNCSKIGDKGQTGLSEWDKLALHIMYPPDNRVAEFIGTTVIRDSEILSLQSALVARGATDFAVNNFVWKIDGQQVSDQPTLDVHLEVGEYTLEFSHLDMLSRDYYYSGKVRVLDEATYNAEIIAPIAADIPLLYPNFFYDINADLSVQPDQHVSIVFPAGLFSNNVVIDYAAQPELDVGNVNSQSIGLFYSLEATDADTGEPAEVLPGQTYSITVNYADTVIPAHINPSSLGLYHWDGLSWAREASSQVDTEKMEVTATPNHFSYWAVLEQPYIYLPMIVRP